jgi:hypothetical protein
LPLSDGAGPAKLHALPFMASDVAAIDAERQLLSADVVDRAASGLGVAAHGADPERAARMDPAVIGTGAGILLPFMASDVAAIDAERQLLSAEDGLYIRTIRDGQLSLFCPLEAEDAGPAPSLRGNSNRRFSRISTHHAVSVAGS